MISVKFITQVAEMSLFHNNYGTYCKPLVLIEVAVFFHAYCKLNQILLFCVTNLTLIMQPRPPVQHFNI